MISLMDVHGIIVTGGGKHGTTRREQTNGKRRKGDKHEHVLTTMYTDVQKITQGLVLIREETQQTNKKLVARDQKLKGLEENIGSEVSTSANAPIHNYTEPMTKKEHMVRENIPKIPY